MITSSINDDDDDDNEQREYYRIDDKALLDYKIITSEQFKQNLNEFQEGIKNQNFFNFLDDDSKIIEEALANIVVDQPDLANYLEYLDRKINLLAHFFITKNKGINEYPMRQINLSGGGIAFDVEQAIPQDAIIELKLVLLPKYNAILAYATVINCVRNEMPENQYLPWRVALNFSNIREIDRDLIIRHVLQQQAMQLRRRIQE